LKLLRQFRTTGRDLSEAGLVSSNSGNISARCRGGIVITRHDSTLAHLEEDDLIEVAFGASSHPPASVELIVHQAIYEATPALAVVHAHPPSAIALSLALATDRIEVVDLASTLLGIVPIIEANAVSGSQALANAMRDALRRSRIALVRGHGSFAVGETLAEACEWTRRLEETCRTLLSTDRSSEERDVR